MQRKYGSFGYSRLAYHWWYVNSYKSISLTFFCSYCLLYSFQTLSAAAGLLLKAVRSHINDVLTVQDHTATIITIPVPTMSMSEEAVTEAPEWNSKKNSQFFKCNSSISNIGKSLSSGNKENEDNKNTEVGRSIQRMRRIEKTLVVRIASVLSVVTVHAALVIAFLTQHRSVYYLTLCTLFITETPLVLSLESCEDIGNF